MKNISLLVPVAAVAVVVPSCWVPRETSTRETMVKLQEYRLCLQQAKCDEVKAIADISALHSLCVAQGRMLERDGWDLDGWGRPFRVDARKTEAGLEVRVWSCGPNGKLEGGGGNGLYVLVVVR